VHHSTTVDQAVHGQASETARQQTERHQTTDDRRQTLFVVAGDLHCRSVRERGTSCRSPDTRQASITLQGGPRGVNPEERCITQWTSGKLYFYKVALAA